MVYVVALLILIGAFYWYGARSDGNRAAGTGTKNQDVASTFVTAPGEAYLGPNNSIDEDSQGNA
jgi:hypothetical protein